MRQFRSKPSIGLGKLAAALALASLLQGCGMGSLTSGIGGGWFGGDSKTATTTGSTGGMTEEQLLLAAKSDSSGPVGVGGEVVQGCPRFSVWSRDGNLTIYEAGRVGDGMAVVHRGEISTTARECQIEQNRVTIKYGFSGRVLLGPRGKTGHVTLPLTVFVTDAKRARVVTDKVKVDVDIALDKPIGYFSMVRSLTFNVPEGARPGEFEVFVGFDHSIPNSG